MWTEEKLLISLVSQNCMGSAGVTSRVPSALMPSLPTSRGHIRLVVYQDATVTTTHLSPSMLPFPSQHLCSAGGMGSGIRLAFSSAGEACNVHLLPQVSLFPVQMTNSTASRHSSSGSGNPSYPPESPVTLTSWPLNSWKLGQEDSSLPLSVQEDRREHPQLPKLWLNKGVAQESTLGQLPRRWHWMWSPTEMTETQRSWHQQVHHGVPFNRTFSSVHYRRCI